MAKKTPLVLISGFLGAGKTTFLRLLLPLLSARGLQPHLIINDYGEAEIDAATLAELSASVQAINGSCVCCESQEEFLQMLEQEQLNPKSVLLVETNGTTDPYEIIECLGLDQRASRYASALHISIIDAKRWQKRWWHNELERRQIRSSGYHYLSKADLVPETRRHQVADNVRSHNPQALPATPDSLAEQLESLSTLPEAQPLITSPKHEPASEAEHHSHAHHHHETAHQFVSLQIPLPPLISREDMTTWLRSLPREVVRAKGFVRIKEAPEHLSSFQKVEDSQEITFLPLSEAFAREPLALVIGVGLNHAMIPPPSIAKEWPEPHGKSRA